MELLQGNPGLNTRGEIGWDRTLEGREGEIVSIHLEEDVFITKRQMNKKTSRLKDMSKDVNVTLRAKVKG